MATECTTVMGQMNQRLKSKEGGDIYKKRKQTVEPVFKIIKETLGFRRFSLSGNSKPMVNGHWYALLIT